MYVGQYHPVAVDDPPLLPGVSADDAKTNGLGWLTPNSKPEEGDGKPPQYCPMTQ